MNSPVCPKCHCADTYSDGTLWICPLCAHEWNPDLAAGPGTDVPSEDGAPLRVCDAHGAVLSDGDTVVVIKDLKIKGASSSLKVGAKVKNIRVVDSSDGHNIACKVEGVGSIHLKSEFVRKA